MCSIKRNMAAISLDIFVVLKIFIVTMTYYNFCSKYKRCGGNFEQLS